MQDPVEYDELDDSLRRCGSNWNAAQAHGFLCSRLAVGGAEAAAEWLDRLLEGSDTASRGACGGRLETVFSNTLRALAERQSEFQPMLPDDGQPTAVRTEALAHWCEGYLHGLVAVKHTEAVKKALAAEPIADVVRDLLQMTRATVDESGDESNEEAYVELVEYIRVATQLVYEELAAFRPAADSGGKSPGPLH